MPPKPQRNAAKKNVGDKVAHQGDVASDFSDKPNPLVWKLLSDLSITNVDVLPDLETLQERDGIAENPNEKCYPPFRIYLGTSHGHGDDSQAWIYFNTQELEDPLFDKWTAAFIEIYVGDEMKQRFSTGVKWLHQSHFDFAPPFCDAMKASKPNRKDINPVINMARYYDLLALRQKGLDVQKEHVWYIEDNLDRYLTTAVRAYLVAHPEKDPSETQVNSSKTQTVPSKQGPREPTLAELEVKESEIEEKLFGQLGRLKSRRTAEFHEQDNLNGMIEMLENATEKATEDIQEAVRNVRTAYETLLTHKKPLHDAVDDVQDTMEELDEVQQEIGRRGGYA